MIKNKIFLLALFSFTWISQSYAIPDWYIHPASYTAGTNLKQEIDSALHALLENPNISTALARNEHAYLKTKIQNETSLEGPPSVQQESFLIENESGLYMSVATIIFDHLSQIYKLHPFLVDPYLIQKLTDSVFDFSLNQLHDFAIKNLILLPAIPGFYLYERIADRFLEEGDYAAAALYFGLLKKYSYEYHELSDDEKKYFDRKNEYCINKIRSRPNNLSLPISYYRIPFLLQFITSSPFFDSPNNMWDLIDDFVISHIPEEIHREIMGHEPSELDLEFAIHAREEQIYFHGLGERLAKIKDQKKLKKIFSELKEIINSLETQEPTLESATLANRAASICGGIGSPLFSDLLRTHLKWRDLHFAVPNSFKDALIHIGKKDLVTVENLIFDLRNENNFRVANTVWVLGGIGNPRAIEPLIMLLIDPNAGIRLEVIDALAKIGGERATNAIATALIHDDNGWVRQLAARNLIDLRDQSTTDALIFAALNNDRMSQYNAIRALGELHNDQSIAALLNILNSEENDYVRAYAALALTDERTDEKVQAALRKVAKNHDSLFGCAARLALEGIKDYDKLQKLRHHGRYKQTP